MNLRDLQYFISVAKNQHFGKAAEESHVSQPALSMQLKKMEEELGVQLFERTNKNVLITSVGEEILERAKTILNLADEIKRIAKTHQDPFSGEIRLGVFPTLAPYFLPLIVPEITKSYPKLKLLLIEEKTDTLVEKLQSGEIDAAFLALPVEGESLATHRLYNDEFYLATPKNHPYASKRIVEQEALRNERLLLLKEGHCLRSQALDVCALTGAYEQQDFQATSLETLRQMVAAGVGMTLMPGLARKENDGLVYIPFKAPAPSRTVGMVWRKASSRSSCLEGLLKLIKQTLN